MNTVKKKTNVMAAREFAQVYITQSCDLSSQEMFPLTYKYNFKWARDIMQMDYMQYKKIW